MPSNLEDLQIPSEFADYRRRLIVYADKKFGVDVLEARFNVIRNFLIHNFGALQKTMTFEIGEKRIKVYYLADENKSVDQAIQSLRQEFRNFAEDFTYEPDARMGSTALNVNDPSAPQQWALERIEAQAAWDRVAQVPPPPHLPVTLAIVDSGIMENHEDLAVAVNPPPVVALPIQGVRFIPPPNGTVADDTGHGTMLAGIIGALRDNATGVAGEGRFINIPAPDQRNMTILALKITDEMTPPSALAAATAIQFAIGMGARIINVAWHVLATSNLLRLAIETAAQAPQGCLVVIAAGNYGSNNTMIPTLPASWGVPDTIAVMASDRNDYKSWFSNYGGNVDLAAPGERVYTTGIYYVNPRYQEFSGTSAAVAHVSAAAALLLSIDDWTPAELRVHLNESADRPHVLWGTCISNGRLNLRRAVCGPFQIVAPAGGQPLQGGLPFNVQWTLEYNSTIVQNAEISFRNAGNGGILGPLFGPFAANTGQPGQPVNVPNQPPGTQAFIRIRSLEKNLYTDSDVFQIL